MAARPMVEMWVQKKLLRVILRQLKPAIKQSSEATDVDLKDFLLPIKTYIYVLRINNEVWRY